MGDRFYELPFHEDDAAEAAIRRAAHDSGLMPDMVHAFPRVGQNGKLIDVAIHFPGGNAMGTNAMGTKEQVVGAISAARSFDQLARICEEQRMTFPRE